jgi:hypothetical protein
MKVEATQGECSITIFESLKLFNLLPERFRTWQLVLPAIIFFSVMSITSMKYLQNVGEGLDGFCRNFESMMSSLSCADVLNDFQIFRNGYSLPAETTLKITTVCLWVTFLSWSTVAAVMLLRLLFAVDFQLTLVTISTVSSSQSIFYGNQKNVNRKYK